MLGSEDIRVLETCFMTLFYVIIKSILILALGKNTKSNIKVEISNLFVI